MKCLVTFLLLFVFSFSALAQAPVAKVDSKAKSTAADKAKNPPASAGGSAQPVNVAYTESIIKNTTDKMFLTEIVDHLPASTTVPSPDKILGYPVGTPNKLTYTKDQYRYYRELEKSSPRVKTFIAPEKSEQGREQMLVVVGDEATIGKLNRYREITAKLADPRTTNDEMAKALIAEGKAIYWASGSIHSPETGSPEMLMEMAYRLAVE